MRGTCNALSSVAVVLTVFCVVFLVGCPTGEVATGAGEGETHPTEAESAPDEGGTEEEVSEVAWQLTSAAFKHGEQIPGKYTGDGDDLSPPLAWTEPPEGTVELALICDDPDAPGGTWNHWVVYGLSPDARHLKEGIPTPATVAEPALKQGVTSFRKTGYGGPSPPPGKAHRYQFTLYALSEKLDLEPGTKKQAVLDAMQGKIIAKSLLEGIYGR